MADSSRVRTLLSVLRGLLAAGIVGFVGWRLAGEWQQTTPPAFQPTVLDGSLAVGTAVAALLLLALLFTASLRLVGPYDPRQRWFYLRIWLQGYFWRYVPGKVLLVVERARLGEQVGIPRATSVVLVLWETLLLLAGAGVVASATLPLVAGGDGPDTALVLAGTAAAVVGTLLLPAGLRLAAARLPALRARLDPALLSLGPLPVLGLVLGYALVWLLLGASFTFTCRCFEGGDAAGAMVALRYVFGYVAGLVLSVTPAGLGVREGLVVAGLGDTFPAAAGLAFALASRVLMTAVELVLVGIATRIPPADTGASP